MWLHLGKQINPTNIDEIFKIVLTKKHSAICRVLLMFKGCHHGKLKSQGHLMEPFNFLSSA